MQIPAQHLRAIRLIHDRLRTADTLWAITGSLGLALQGVPVAAIHDIDLQSDATGAYAIQSVLREYVTSPVGLRESERIRSHFGALEIEGLKVEIMGDMQKRASDGGWEPAPDLSALIRWVDDEELRLPVLDLAYEQQAYQRTGRPEKAALIARFLSGAG